MTRKAGCARIDVSTLTVYTDIYCINLYLFIIYSYGTIKSEFPIG